MRKLDSVAQAAAQDWEEKPVVSGSTYVTRAAFMLFLRPISPASRLLVVAWMPSPQPGLRRDSVGDADPTWRCSQSSLRRWLAL